MKLIIGSLLAAAAIAAPLRTCSDQSKCLKFDAKKITDDADYQGECYYKICMTLDLDNGDCDKDGQVSHTCEKDDEIIFEPNHPGGFSKAEEKKNIENMYNTCQLIEPGSYAEFLLKDSNPNNGCGSLSNFPQLGASCETLTAPSCTGPGNAGKECVWTIQAPQNCNHVGGGFGDPHIRRWDQGLFHFHGECDLVLLSAKNIDLHIRTTVRSFYSFIETAALAVGNVKVQVSHGNLLLNGTALKDDALPLMLPEFALFADNMDFGKIYTVKLERRSRIQIKVIGDFLSVIVSGHGDDFGDAVGLMGNYHTGAALGRDGITVIEDSVAYGMEWQVQPDEPKLFKETRKPQLPHAQCTMPTATNERRRLRHNTELLELANKACAPKHDEVDDFQACIEDVMATGDTSLAEAW